ncbi:MAG TPA: filamentous hemagglutinin N-terminal domain-containing protein, partial [Gallionella sp.]|nr:filamentous hemagglutinin N-terminal domain-containing protein [Gallionella sp.]
MANFIARNDVYSTGERDVRVRRARLLLAVALWFGVTLQAQANPIGAQVVSGTANINQAGNTLTVTNSPNAILNWQGFSIAPGEVTRFIQQNANSAVLNRVIGTDPSQLLGTLSSNGRVFLVNPSGILVGQGARIDVAGLVASTLNLSDADFLSNNYNFAPTLRAAGVLNAGSITTPEGGTVYLIAPQVENQGFITTPKGETILAAGNAVQLIDTATPGVSVQIAGSGNNAVNVNAVNVGRILADSGRIGMVGALVRNSGELNASSLVSQGGRVFLKASQDTYVDKDATISTTGSTGGNIEVLGNRVAVMDNARLDASGQDGGGTVLVGGDYQGKNPAVQNAQNTFVGSNATIRTDATDTGNGGKVIVWADDTTRAYGSISARGGISGGDGGFVEVSGHRYLDFLGRVDTRAPQGTDGTLLLDPADIWIDNSVDNYGSGTFSAGVFSGATAVPSTLTWATINAQTGSLVINTAGTGGAGNININASGTVTGPSTLTLLANNDINVANAVAVSGGNFNLIAGWNNTGWAVTPGTGIINLGAGSSLSGNSLIFSAGNSITSSGLITANLLQVQSTGAVSLPGLNQVNTLAANVTAGTFSFENAAAGGLTIGSITSALGTVNGVAASGAITMRQYTSGGITVNQDVASSAGDVLLGIASGGGGITTNAIVSGLNTQVYTGGGDIAVNAGLTAATGTATLYSGAGAITTPTGLINANTIALQSNAGGSSGAIGVNSLNPLRTSAIGGAGNSSNIAIGNVTGPGSVYLRHTGDAVLNSVITSGAAVPVNIEAIGNLTANSPISTGNGNVSLTGNAITFTAAGDITAGTGTVNLASTGANALTSIVLNTAITGADINIKTDNLSLLGTLSATNAATITRFNNNVEVQVGGAGNDGAGFLNVNSTELANITAGLYRFGDTTSTGGLRVAGAVSIPATKTLSLLTSNIGGSQIVQNAGATITADNLRAEGGSGVTLNEANAVANLSGKTLSGDFRFTNNSALNLSTVDGQAGINSGAGVWLTGVSLSQSANAIITATSLNANSTGGSVILTEANPVGVISGATTGGDFVYNSANLLTVSNVAGVNGLSVPTTFNIRLSSNVGINQNPGSVIKANGASGGGLALVTPGHVTLGEANDVRTIAASLTGAGSNFKFKNSENVVPGTVGDLVVGSLTVGGVTTTGITSNGGDINLGTPGLLTVLNPIAAGAGRVGLFADDLILSNTVTSNSEVGIVPYSANIPITVGAACGSPPCLSVTNLWKVNAPTIGIGEDGVLGSGAGTNPISGAISVAGITTGGTGLSDRHANTTRIGLFSGAGITQTGAINVQNLGISAGTSVTLPLANLVGNLAGKSAAGPFEFTNAQPLNIVVLSGGSGFSVYSMPGIQAVGDVLLTANGGINLANTFISSSGIATLSATGGLTIGSSTSDAYVFGSPDVNLTLGGDLAFTASGIYKAYVSSGQPATTNLTFTNTTAKVLFNGVQAAATTSGNMGFLFGATPAVLGSNLVVTSGDANNFVATVTPPPPPTLAQCVANPTIVGCTAVLPPLADCTLNPALAGCTAVLPPLADCTLNPTLAGCTAVLPPLADCTLNPTLAGCTAVLPPLADCTLNPTLA